MSFIIIMIIIIIIIRWADAYDPYTGSQINSFRNSNGLSCFLKVLHTISSLDVVRELIPKAWCKGTVSSVTDLFRLVRGICNKFFEFDLRLLVMPCLTNSSLRHRGLCNKTDCIVRQRSAIPESGFSRPS